jgi:hypothetical protein
VRATADQRDGAARPPYATNQTGARSDAAKSWRGDASDMCRLGRRRGRRSVRRVLYHATGVRDREHRRLQRRSPSAGHPTVSTDVGRALVAHHRLRSPAWYGRPRVPRPGPTPTTWPGPGWSACATSFPGSGPVRVTDRRHGSHLGADDRTALRAIPVPLQGLRAPRPRGRGAVAVTRLPRRRRSGSRGHW